MVGPSRKKNHPGCFSSLQWSVMPCTGLVKFLSSIVSSTASPRLWKWLSWTGLQSALICDLSAILLNKEQIELHIINLVVLYTYSFEMYSHLMELYVWLVIIYIVVQIMFVNGVIYYVRLTCLHTKECFSYFLLVFFKTHSDFKLENIIIIIDFCYIFILFLKFI